MERDNDAALAPVYRYRLDLVLRPHVVLSGRQGGQRTGQRQSSEEDAGPRETIGLLIWERFAGSILTGAASVRQG